MRDNMLHTFREGLLPREFPLTACWATLLAGVVGEGRPLSTSSGIPPFSFSWELDGPAASLLGTGVMLLMEAFLKAGFLGGSAGFAIALVALFAFSFRAPLEELGVPFAGAFVKKLAIDRCVDCEPLEFCFFNVGVDFGVASVASLLFPIVTSRQQRRKSVN